jgi:radical SAM superfamily enzyme YgiQ (UPF0313 family)
MNFLIVYPKRKNINWDLEYVMKFWGIVDGYPPLVLLKISSMLPRVWTKKLIDMNGSRLKDEDIQWADFVMISAELNQAKSANEIIERCNKLNAKTVACGSLFTNNYEYYKKVDHLVSYDEAEIALPQFLDDLSDGEGKQKYASKIYPNITPAY